jgi:hypothetical protein
MSINRANMANQISKPPMKKQKPRGMKHGGPTCRGMGAAKKGGRYKT